MGKTFFNNLEEVDFSVKHIMSFDIALVELIEFLSFLTKK